MTKNTDFDLIRKYPLKVIRNETELDASQAVIDSCSCRDERNYPLPIFPKILADCTGNGPITVHKLNFHGARMPR